MSGKLAVAGERNNFLTLVRLHEKRRGGYLWVAKCDCGNEAIVIVRDFRSGHTKSCGCYAKARKPFLNRIHGMSETAEFRIWCHMINRCYSTGDRKFKYYGARGITVCDGWRKAFLNFYRDVGPRPSSLHSLDRIDNDKGYYPENCRWATGFEQARNKRNNVFVLVGGRKMVMAQAEQFIGIGQGSIRQRAKKRQETYQDSTDHFVRKHGEINGRPEQRA